MTSTTAPAPAAVQPAAPPVTGRQRRLPSHARPARVLGAIAHLAALGIVGPAVISVLFGILGAGFGLLFALGIGVVVLAGLVYVLYGIAWLETARVEGLYQIGLPPLALRPRTVPGFKGALLMWVRQAIDPAMWRALANAAISTILGLLVLALVTAASAGVVVAFAPLYSIDGVVRIGPTGFDVIVAWAPLLGGVVAIVALAATVGVALVHGLLATVVVAPSREAELEAQVRTSDSRRVGALRAADVERTRIERDLHDGVQPRLVSVGMTLGLARQKLDDDPDAAKALIDEAHTSTKAAITELRQLARGIHASVLDDRGLDAALSALAARSHVPVQLDVRIDQRCGRTAETAVYFAIAESLTNAAKHSRAAAVRVVVRQRDDGATLWARIEDDGIGGARIIPGGGLDGISNRIVAAGGETRLDSPVGGPTALEVSVPCAS